MRVSYIVLAYNQEAYIREAVKSAFEQENDYIEVILSDDSSTDNTFAIMNEMASSYHGGKIVKVRRNDRNIGVGAHLNQAVLSASGDVLVLMAGDDIAFPHRTDRIISEFRRSARVQCVFSNSFRTDHESKLTKELQFPQGQSFDFGTDTIMRQGVCWVHGATAAYSRAVFESFPPLNSEIIHEDKVLPFRARLIGDIRYIPDPLIFYRQHDRNLYNRSPAAISANPKAQLIRTARQDVAVAEQRLLDTQFLAGENHETSERALQLLLMAKHKLAILEKPKLSNLMHFVNWMRLYNPRRSFLLNIISYMHLRWRTARKENASS